MKKLFFILSTLLLIGQSKYELDTSENLLSSSLLVLQTQIGIVEASGSNDGPEIELYQKAGGGSKGQPWCYYLQYWAFWEANKCLNNAIPIPKGGLAQLAYNKAKREGTKVKYEAKKHDLITWKKKGGWSGHIERIDSVMNNGWVRTIGGNTSNGKQGDQREGNGCFHRIRNIKHPLSRLLLVSGLVGFKTR